MKLEFSPKIFEKYSKSYFTDIRPVTAELFHADGHTYRQTNGQRERDNEASIAFRNIANVPKY